MGTIVIATRNRHKVAEIQQILGGPWRFLSTADLVDPPEIAETGETFEANARLKATGLAGWLASTGAISAQEPTLVLADDSGLEVDALGGAPGVHSARYAATASSPATNSPDAANNAKLLEKLRELPDLPRTARFRCVLAVAVWVRHRSTRTGGTDVLPPVHIFQGSCEGAILPGPRGSAGFGYDPLFQPSGHTQSFAELGESEKNRLSHRAAALRELKDWFTQHPSWE